jgi:hypothetical protein
MANPFLTRRSTLITTLAIAAVAFLVSTYASSTPLAQDKQGKQGKHEKNEGDEKESPLEQAMQMMQGGQKRLDKALAGKDLAAALPIVVDMQRAAIAAKVETPPKADEISDAKKKAEFVNGFRKQVIALQKALCDLEIAAIDGKADEATRIYETQIKPMKKEGHAKYKGD